MGRDLTLLIERKTESGWIAPLELLPLFPNGAVHQVWANEPQESDLLKVLEIDWWPIRRPATALFSGTDTPLDVVPGIPTDATAGASRYFMQNWGPDDPYLGSIAVRDLLLDDWHQSLVTLRGKWPAWVARLTGDGRKARTELENALNEMSISPETRSELIGQLQLGQLALDPIDQLAVSADRDQKSDTILDITWLDPLDSFVSWLMPTMDALRSSDIGDCRIIIG